MIEVPAHIVEIRRQTCLAAGCVHELDYADPCSECPGGHWGRYIRDCAMPLPSLAARARNLALAVAQETVAVAAGIQPLTKEEIQARLDICFAPCEYLTKDGECSLCGCPMVRKAPWRSQKCKAGKW